MYQRKIVLHVAILPLERTKHGQVELSQGASLVGLRPRKQKHICLIIAMITFLTTGVGSMNVSEYIATVLTVQGVSL